MVNFDFLLSGTVNQLLTRSHGMRRPFLAKSDHGLHFHHKSTYLEHVASLLTCVCRYLEWHPLGAGTSV